MTTALVTAFVIVSMLLVAPIRIGLSGGTAPTRHVDFDVRFASLPIRRLWRPRPRKASRRRPGTGIQRVLAAYRALRRWVPMVDPLLGPPGRRWIQRTFRSATITDSGGELVLGLDDPADTGVAFGALSGLRAAADLPLDIVPDFTTPRFDLSGHVRFRTNLARLSLPSLLFALDPKVWWALWRVVFPLRTASEDAP